MTQTPTATTDDSSRFAEIYEVYSPRVLREARCWTASEAAAEDLTGEVWLTLISRGLYPPVGAEWPWFRRVIGNHARSLHRKTRPRNQAIEIYAESLRRRGAGQHSEQSRELREEIERLPTEIKDVVDLLVFHRLSGVEVSKILHISQKAVYKRFAAAKKILRLNMGDIIRF